MASSVRIRGSIPFLNDSQLRHSSWLLSVPYRKALPNMGRAFQFVDHREGVILN